MPKISFLQSMQNLTAKRWHVMWILFPSLKEFVSLNITKICVMLCQELCLVMKLSDATAPSKFNILFFESLSN